jgi:4-hydroxymandelate oxidase
MGEPVNIEEFEAIARDRLDRGAFDYYAGGADDEITLRENREAFRRLALRYRVLVDVSNLDTRTTFFGHTLSFPAILAPTAMHRMAHPDGERATARAAAAAGLLHTLSSVSSVSIEDVAAAAPSLPRWFQLYVYTNRAKSKDLVSRAYESGYEGIVLTVDLPRLGRRERDMRNAFAFPEGVAAVNLSDIDKDTGTPLEILDQDPALSWDDLAWLGSLAPLPIILKGIVRADDAVRAIEHGAAAVWVSNHGGRQLDTAIASLDALPPIVDAVAGRVPVVVDGGVRRGTDIVKALALGANVVAIGRPQLWGLAAGGEDGVRRVLEMLREEFALAMALCGCASVAGITRDLIA